MSVDYIYKVPLLDDNQVFSSFKEAHEKFHKLGKTSDLRITVHLPALSQSEINATDNVKFEEIESLVKNGSSRMLHSMLIAFNNFHLRYNRTCLIEGVPQPCSEVRIRNNGTTQLSAGEMFSIINQLLNSLYVHKIGDSAETDKSFVNSHAEILSKLESFGLDLQKDTKNFRDVLEQEHVKKTKQLEDSFSEKTSALETKYSVQLMELEAKRKEIDDKNNTHARQEIRKDLTNAVTNRIQNFKLSNDTSKLRTPIHWAFILLILCSGTAIVLYSLQFNHLIENPEFSKITTAVVIALLKPIGFAILFSTAFILYIKWLNAWFSKTAEEEMLLRRFSLDVDRSSWIVETVLESVSQHKHQLPKELVLRFSNNLFAPGAVINNEVEHPLEQMTEALLSSAGRTRLKLGDNEIEVEAKAGKSK